MTLHCAICYVCLAFLYGLSGFCYCGFSALVHCTCFYCFVTKQIDDDDHDVKRHSCSEADTHTAAIFVCT